MMQVESYREEYRSAFARMFVTYSVDDLRMQEKDPRLTAACVEEKVVPFFLKQREKGASKIDIALADGKPIGFAIWQIDGEESDWCERLGWGFIMEFYIAKEHRHRGLGRCLAETVEAKLREMGAEKLYLTTSGAGKFWSACGYVPTGERMANGTFVYEKV